MLKFLLALTALGACAEKEITSKVKDPDRKPVASEISYREKPQPDLRKDELDLIQHDPSLFPIKLPTREELSNLEFLEPKNSSLKWQSAILEWCSGEKGSAFERWSWIVQFDPRSKLARLSRLLIQRARDQDESTVSKTLGCLKSFPKN